MNKRWVLIASICAVGLFATWAACMGTLPSKVSLSLVGLALLYLWFSAFLVAYSRRYWLIPMLLLLPVITFPGMLAIASFAGKLGEFVYLTFLHFPGDIKECQPVLWCCFIPSLLVLFIWGGYRLWQRKYSFKRGMIQFSFITLISLLLWILALGFNTIRASNAVRNVMKKIDTKQPMREDKNSKAVPVIFEELEKQSEAIKQKYPGFQPPIFGKFSWLKNKKDGFSESQDKIINQTLGNQDSPEVKALYGALDALPQQAPFTGNFLFLKEKDSIILMTMRQMGRYFVGRSQLAHYTNKTDEILPPLERMIVLDEIMLDSDFLIVELIRTAIYSSRTEAILSLGPVGEKYAPFYAKELDASLKREYSVPSELGFVVLGVRHYLKHVTKPSKYFFNQVPNISFPCALLLRPLKLNIGCMAIKNALLAEKCIPEFRNSPAPSSRCGISFFPDPNYLQKNCALRGRLAQTVAQTGFALKLYHCKNGHYPEKLEQLVPGILKSLPIDPYTGLPLRYILVDGEFFFNSSVFRFASNPNY